MSRFLLNTSPFTDAIFLLEGIDWLRWLVAFFFSMLGLFAGWWQWGYKRPAKESAKPEPKEPEKPVENLLVPDVEDAEPAEASEQGKPFGGVFESEPENSDDLSRIRGIGKALKAKLNAIGIYRFRQIAAWDEPQTRAIAKELHLANQIQKDGWIEQATRFAGVAEEDSS